MCLLETALEKCGWSVSIAKRDAVMLPPSDAQPPRFLPRRPQMLPPASSMPVTPQIPPPTTFPILSPPVGNATGAAKKMDDEHAINFATSSWDLATGGLKTMTAKRELPSRPDRRSLDATPVTLTASHSYMLALVILVCVLLMLIGGGVVLFVILQS